MSLELILSRLDKVRGSGQRYRAVCPVHGGTSASTLLVTEKPDGAITVYCFNCGAKGPQVAAALGIPLPDLFPPKVEYRRVAGSARPVAPVRPPRRYYDFDGCGPVFVAAVIWERLTEYQAIRWQAEQQRLYDRFGPTLRPQPNLKDKPPAWAAAMRAGEST